MNVDVAADGGVAASEGSVASDVGVVWKKVKK